jgi:cytochrome c5
LVKNFLLNKLAQKKYWMTLCILLIAAITYGFYAFISISQNLRDMAGMEEVEYYPAYPIAKTTPANAELVKRGEYLTKAGDCIACHTNTALKEKSKQFAGGLPMITPFGTIYTPNITSDKEYGIGKWTDDEFIKAMAQGISPDGHYYYPAFPYMYFNRFTHDDLKAIKAYLVNIPAVNQPNRANSMMFPFNIRLLQLGWRILFFHSENTGPYKPDPKQTAEWNRGAYLTNGAGHCAMCHSPSYTLLSDLLPLAAPIRKYDYTGAKVQGYLAPNISKSNIGNTPDSEMLDVFKKDMLVGGGNVVGPMKEVNHDSLIYLTDADLTAITHYLKTVDSQLPPKIKSSSSNPGAGTYDNYCAGCHTMGGGGAPKFGDPNAWASYLKLPKDDVYHNAIKGINGMPAKGTCSTCSDDDIKQAVDYMLLAASSAKSTGPVVPAPKKLTIADGKRIYDENCSVCHNAGFKNAPKPGDVKAWEPIVDKGFYHAFINVSTGKNGHVAHGGCDSCTDGDLIAAMQYMMQSSAPGKDYSLW